MARCCWAPLKPKEPDSLALWARGRLPKCAPRPVGDVLKAGGVFRPVVDGYTSTIVSILFLGGVQLMSVGILGEYIGRIYDEVKRRPLFIIHRIHQAEPSHEPRGV